MMEYFDSGAKGIKMHTGIQNFEPDDPELASIYSSCNERRIPVTFHCGETSRVHMNEFAEMSHIIPVVRKYKSIPFVLTHLASGDPETVIQIAEECPNVILDTSIALTGECCIHRIHDLFWEDDRNTYELIRKIGAERFAFGSDYPFGNPASDIAGIRNLGLSESETEKILGLNTYRLYFENKFLNKKTAAYED
ncbi:MAG: amidohydrolase family protein [Erysipelotrichaceae bacterium]|nr:amidohydrolase family protein [Erysipelotrichaceae bacterium]